MEILRDAGRFVLALVLFIPTAIIVLMAYAGMIIAKEVLRLAGYWEGE